VAAKFEIEKANMRVSRNIAISHRIVPAWVGNSGIPTAIRKVLQISGIGGFTTPGHYTCISWKSQLSSIWCNSVICLLEGGTQMVDMSVKKVKKSMY